MTDHALKLAPRHRAALAKLLPDLTPELVPDASGERAVVVGPEKFARMHEAATGALSEAADKQRRKFFQGLIEKLDAAVEAVRAAAIIYRIKVTLRHTDPPIWRRFETRDLNFGDLHWMLQDVMGWDNSHLHEFEIGKRRIGMQYDQDFFADFERGPRPENEEKVRLSEVLKKRPTPKQPFKFLYTYDFGDTWEHEVVVEEVCDADENTHYPRCVAGELACPPEDCGGVWGYYDGLEALAKPESEVDEEDAWRREWWGERDPQAFSAEEVNAHWQPKGRRRGR